MPVGGDDPVPAEETVMTMRVLVVDDEPGINDLICDALRLAGYETSSAAHGMEALRILRDVLAAARPLP